MINNILNKVRHTFTRLEWHDLKNIEPVSRLFGLDRGTPIDRYYIGKFLTEKSAYIKGTVVEVADNFYSKKYGTGVTSYEVLHVENRSNATIVGDLSKKTLCPSVQLTVLFVHRYLILFLISKVLSKEPAKC